MAKKECGACKKYWPLEKGVKGAKVKKLTRGYCLARTVFPSNRAGEHVYPPGAKVEETPFGTIKAFLVKKDQIVIGCSDRVVEEGRAA